MENSKPTSDDRSLCIPPECIKLMNKQVTEPNGVEQVYIDRTIKDYDCFSDFVGSPSTVLDWVACRPACAKLDDTLSSSSQMRIALITESWRGGILGRSITTCGRQLPLWRPTG